MLVRGVEGEFPEAPRIPDVGLANLRPWKAFAAGPNQAIRSAANTGQEPVRLTPVLAIPPPRGTCHEMLPQLHHRTVCCRPPGFRCRQAGCADCGDVQSASSEVRPEEQAGTRNRSRPCRETIAGEASCNPWRIGGGQGLAGSRHLRPDAGFANRAGSAAALPALTHRRRRLRASPACAFFPTGSSG